MNTYKKFLLLLGFSANEDNTVFTDSVESIGDSRILTKHDITVKFEYSENPELVIYKKR